MSLLSRISRWLSAVRLSRPSLNRVNLSAPALSSSEEGIVPFDPYLLDRVKNLWIFGDYAGLSLIDRGQLLGHPQRGLLAAYIGAAHQQTNAEIELIRSWYAQAKDWGCSAPKLMEIMLSNAHVSLADIKLVMGDRASATEHLAQSFVLTSPGVPTDKLLGLRIGNLAPQVFPAIGESTDAWGTITVASTDPVNVANESVVPSIDRSALIQDVLKESLSWGSSQNSSDIDVSQAHEFFTGEPKQVVEQQSRAQYLNANGEFLYSDGKFKLAAEYFQRACDLVPNSATYMQNLAEAVARLPYKSADVWECESLGKMLKESGKWDFAVRCYRNALRLDPVVVKLHQDAQTFNVEPPHDATIENPVFVVGCGHSGTSVMLAILGNHTRINPIPEETALFLKTDSAIQKTMREWDIECQSKGAGRWVEKTPPHIFQIHRLLAFRPKAQIVLMVRDGRDVVCSLRPRVGYAAFEDRLDRWIYDNMAGLPYWNHPQVKVVKYEDLVSETESTLYSICRFLGEEYQVEMLDYYKTEHLWYSDKIVKPEEVVSQEDHQNNRNWQINQPLFDGRGRWISEMTDSEKQIFKASPAQALLQQFGYVGNDAW